MKGLKNKYILYIIAFFQGLVFYGAFATIYRLDRGLQLNEIFFLESIFVLLMMFFEIPWGVVGDKIGYKKTLNISFGLFLLSKVAFYYANSFNMFLLEAILAALAISGISGCDSAILYGSIKEEDSDKTFGRYSACSTLGFLISSLLSGVMVKKSLDLLALATIMAYVVTFLLSFFLKDVKFESNEKKETIIESLKSSLVNKKILIFIILIAVISETTHSVCVFLNQPLYIRSGIDMKWFGILAAFMQIATFIAIRAHVVKKRIGRNKTYIVALILIIIANTMLIVTNISYITIVLIFIIEGSFAITQPLTETIKNASIDSINRATILSAYAMIGNIVAAFCNIIIGFFAKISLNSALVTCVILNCIVFLIGYILIKNSKILIKK
ncbi:MFS transporter [Clostridium senegalense]|uniref:MFS transporter n=1 Tax=Clostridium senegalense TaxID=1465809 RepID=A0A6M0H6K3_9CLOT|nr:MFS transporter [Clostridium senegalense]NEU05623.1 MFS transporter [Clostridium senegalense]